MSAPEHKGYSASAVPPEECDQARIAELERILTVTADENRALRDQLADLRDRANKAEANAAVMREQLTSLVDADLDFEPLDSWSKAKVNAALASDAGAALLAERDALKAALRKAADMVEDATPDKPVLAADIRHLADLATTDKP